GSGDGSALSTLLTAQLLPQVMNSGQSSRVSLGANSDNVSDAFDNAQGAVSAAAERQQQLSEEYQRRQESAMRQQFEKGEGYGEGRRRCTDLTEKRGGVRGRSRTPPRSSDRSAVFKRWGQVRVTGPEVDPVAGPDLHEVTDFSGLGERQVVVADRVCAAHRGD